MALTDEGIIDVPGMLSRWVNLPSGAKAHYMTAGESGPNVVLLHGGIVGSSGTAGWRFMAPFLAENGFRVYCPDQPGFGLTEGAERYHPSPAGHVDFLHDFVTVLNLDRFHLAGNSMGCQNSSNYTLAHPERVISTALIASAAFGGDISTAEERKAADSRPADPNRPSTSMFDGTPDSMKRMMEGIIYRAEAITDDLLTMRTSAANRNMDYTKARAEYTRNPDPNIEARLSMKGRFEKLSIPMIYLHGKQDVLAPVEVSYKIYEPRIGNVQFFYPDECGHQGQTDQPEMFNQVFLEFFRDGKVSRKTADWAGVSKNRPELSQVVASA
jgi:pimeloyl-ACP methyl ester carboxylesterase